MHHALLFLLALCVALGFAQIPGEPLRPQWCRELPRPEYKRLERVSVPSDWFEVYRVRPGVFAIYEPHQFEEVISYLILGERLALLFDIEARYKVESGEDFYRVEITLPYLEEKAL